MVIHGTHTVTQDEHISLHKTRHENLQTETTHEHIQTHINNKIMLI